MREHGGLGTPGLHRGGGSEVAVEQFEHRGCGVLSRPLHFTDKDTRLQGDGLPSVTELAEAGLEHRLRCLVPKKNTALCHIITAAAVDKPTCTERTWLGRMLRDSG